MYIQRGNKYLKSLSVKSEALPAGARRWNQKFEDLNWKNIFPQKSKFQNHYRHSAAMVSDTTRAQNSSNRPISIFCVKLLVHHCVSYAVRKKKPHGCTKSESFLKNLPSVIRERCVNCKQFEITEKVCLFFLWSSPAECFHR